MNPDFSNSSPSSARAISAAALRLELQQEAEEDRLSVQKGKSRLWPLALASLALVVMLLTFYFVVHGVM